MIHYSYEEIIKLLKQKIKTGPYAHLTFEEKFWKQVNKNSKKECWEFTKQLFPNGYGRFNVNHINFLAHRISYLICYKELPENKIIMHLCDNRKCVNPIHLYLGTHSENAQDMINKNRGKYHRGINNWRCKLTDEDVFEIILFRQQGIPGKILSKRYNVSCPQIYRIANGKRRSIQCK